MLKHFAALSKIFKRSIYNYFDGPTKLFSDPYPTKFLDTSVNSFRVYINY